jgi:hypothetical protein
MMMTCSKCGEEFELKPDKPGFANVCLSCTHSPEEYVRKAAEEHRQQASMAAARRTNSLNAEQKHARDLKLQSLGLKRVGRAFTVNVPK